MSTDPDEARAADIRHGKVAIALAEALCGRDMMMMIMMHAMIDTVQNGDIARDLWRLHGNPLDEEAALQRWRLEAVQFEARKLFKLRQIGIPDVSLDEVLHAAADALHYYQHGELPPA